MARPFAHLSDSVDFGRLDLHDIRAEIRKQTAAKRPGDGRRKLDNSTPCERAEADRHLSDSIRRSRGHVRSLVQADKGMQLGSNRGRPINAFSLRRIDDIRNAGMAWIPLTVALLRSVPKRNVTQRNSAVH